MNSRGSRGSARSKRQPVRHEHRPRGERAAAPRAAVAGSLHVSMKARCSSRIALDVPRRAHALGHREARQLPRVEGGDRAPAAGPRRSGSSAAARSTSPGASQSPSRSGAKPSQVSAERSRWRSVRWSSGTVKVTSVHPLPVRLERMRPADALGRLAQHRARRARSARRGSRVRCGSARGGRAAPCRSRVARVAGAATPAPSSTSMSTLARSGPGRPVDDVLAEEREQQLLRLTAAHAPPLSGGSVVAVTRSAARPRRAWRAGSARTRACAAR